MRNNATPVLPGYKLAKTPGFAHALTIGKVTGLGGGYVLTPRVNWTYTGAQYHDAINTRRIFQDGYHLLNARVSVQTGDDRWELLLAARNLTDARYLVTGTSAFDTSAAYVERVYGRPSEWSVSVGYRW